MKKFLYLFLCCTLFIISACASSETASTGSSDTGNTTYTISINGPDTVYTSSQNNYTITTSPEGVSVTGVEWSVDNKTLAVIDASTGVLTARNTAGQVTITATANGKTATKLVTIKKDLKISGNNTTAIGGKITLKVLNNTSNNLTWSSDNQAVATVENGVITGVSAGTANITVSEGGNTSNIFAVTIKDVPNGYETDNTGAYHVYNIDGFNAWRNAVSTTPSTNCYLYSDLDFANSTPSTISSYQGIFEGNGHIIKNYNMTNSGFISSLYGGKLLNVTFDNANISYEHNMGLWGTNIGMVTSSISNNGIIENVHVTNSEYTVISNISNSIGIITGGSTGGTIKNCSVTNSTLTADGKMGNLGGIIGIISIDNQAGVTVSGCFVENLTITASNGAVNSNNGIGSIVGKQSSDIVDTIIGCGAVNTTITNAGIGYVGGIAGSIEDSAHASYFYGTLHNLGTNTGLDFGAFSGTAGKASTNYVKNQGGTVDTITNQDSTTLVDDTTVTWEQAVESMNQYLIDKKYTDFKYKYDSNKGYPVIEYSK